MEEIKIKIWRTGNSTINLIEGYTIHCGIYEDGNKTYGYTDREDQIKGLILTTLTKHLEDYRNV